MTESAATAVPKAQERLMQHGPQPLSDVELITLLLGPTNGANSTRAAAQQLLEAKGLQELAWASADELMQHSGIGPTRAAALAAAFELGRRHAWSPPQRGERCLDPARVYELLRPMAFRERECFAVVLLDVRGRLLTTEIVAEGSLTQCPVNPRDVLRPAIKAGAHGVVFVHNHPSGEAAPSADDVDLTERLRLASDLVGVLARDHLIIASGGYFSFVEAGRWRR